MAEETATIQSETETQTNTEEAGKPRPLSLLAKEMFGPAYHGPVPEEKQEQTEQKTETEQKEQETSETTDEQKTDETKESETEEVPISSLSELIEHNEWDPEWVQSLRVPIKVDGAPGEVSLKDLTASYQIQQAAEKRLTEAKEKAKALDQELTQHREAVQAQFATAAGLIQEAEQFLDADSKSIDWTKLRESDPAEYSARKAEFAERKQIIEGMKRKALETYQKSSQEQQEKAQAQFKEHLKAEAGALLEKLPEWRDPEKAKAGQQQLSEYLRTQGFTDQDIAAAYDHRMILMARKAMLYDKGQTKVSTALKKVAKVPKVLKPGSPKPPDQVNKEQIEKAKAKLRQTGSRDDALALLKIQRGKR